jgi:predicted O-linked N-acetylglucosamine transferase (SPINDLY family)
MKSTEDLQQIFTEALSLQKNKRYQEAWQKYQHILRSKPLHLPTLRQMARICYEIKEYKQAENIYTQITTLDPLDADSLYKLGMTYTKLESEQSITAFRRTLKIVSKDNARAWQATQLQLAKALKNHEKYRESKERAEKLVEKNPQNSSALSLLGEIAQKEGDNKNAYEYFKKVVALLPLKEQGHYNLGVVCGLLNKNQESISYLEKAINLNPSWSNPYRELARWYHREGRADESLALLKKALQLNPKDKENLRGIADYYRSNGEQKTSIEYEQKIVTIDSEDRQALFNIGSGYSILGYSDGALEYFRKAFAIKEDGQTAFAIGMVLNVKKEFYQAAEWFQKTLELNPNHHEAQYNLLFHKMSLCDWSTRKQDERTIIELLRKQTPEDTVQQNVPALNFNYFGLPMDLHLVLNKLINRTNQPTVELLKKQVDFSFEKKPKDILHIGYISPDLRDHPVGRITADLFAAHDRTRVKVFLYALTPYSGEDAVAQRIFKGSDIYRELAFCSDVEGAQIIYNDQIDILIDMAGHTANNRHRILGLQPAPIQTHFIGYPNTTGMDYMQYILADKYLVPEHVFPFYSERVWHLPSCFIGNRAEYTPPTKTKSDFGLPKDEFVFVGFNRPAKIEPAVFNSWMNILNGVENSILWLSDFEEETRKNVIAEAQKRGVAVERIHFAPRRSAEEYKESLKVADLFLDTWHYSAGSTAIAALAAGIPVLTVVDESNASRMGASIVAAAGIKDLICEDLVSYQKKAIELARNPSQIERYKKHLRQPNEKILLFNNHRFAQNLENAFQEMWQIWLTEV